MTRSTPFIIGMALLALSACANGQPAEPATDTGAVIDNGENTDETKNVLYRGTVEEAGASVYMQGTHRIKLENGTYVLLESDDVNLNRYVGDKVEVFGSVRPTVEAGGLIMRVQSITSLEAQEASSVSSKIFCGGIAAFQCPDTMDCIDDPSDSCDPNSGGADCGGICVQRSASSVSAAATSSVTSTTTSAAAQSSQQASSIASIATSSVAATTSAASSLPSWEGSADLTAKAKLMAQANMDMSLWTQKYCSTQIGFCIPVHKNWWYKSFGTTSSYLWHLEIGTTEMNNLGEGPISVNLVSGDAATAGLTDGSVTVQGDTVVGIRSWTGNRHFEFRGPAILEAAVRILVRELKTN